ILTAMLNGQAGTWFCRQMFEMLTAQKKIKSTSKIPSLAKRLSRRIRCGNECQSSNNTLASMLQDFCKKKITTEDVTMSPCVSKAMKEGDISEEQNFPNLITLLIQVLRKCQEYLKQLITNSSYRYDNPQRFRHMKNETVILESQCLHLLHVFWSYSQYWDMHDENDMTSEIVVLIDRIIADNMSLLASKLTGVEMLIQLIHRRCEKNINAIKGITVEIIGTVVSSFIHYHTEIKMKRMDNGNDDHQNDNCNSNGNLLNSEMQTNYEQRRGQQYEFSVLQFLKQTMTLLLEWWKWYGQNGLYLSEWLHRTWIVKEIDARLDHKSKSIKYQPTSKPFVYILVQSILMHLHLLTNHYSSYRFEVVENESPLCNTVSTTHQKKLSKNDLANKSARDYITQCYKFDSIYTPKYYFNSLLSSVLQKQVHPALEVERLDLIKITMHLLKLIIEDIESRCATSKQFEESLDLYLKNSCRHLYHWISFDLQIYFKFNIFFWIMCQKNPLFSLSIFHLELLEYQFYFVQIKFFFTKDSKFRKPFTSISILHSKAQKKKKISLCEDQRIKDCNV
ncbi:hypothetical protein RFI_21786, partial [Reticulomyxa filosa]